MTQVSGSTTLLEPPNHIMRDQSKDSDIPVPSSNLPSLNVQQPVSSNVSVDDTSSETGDGTVSDKDSKHRFFCPQCNHGFTRSHNLKSHVLTHTHEKPFTCAQCSSQFRRINDLKRHLRLHTGEKPYKCKICRKTFSRNDALIRHQKNSVCKEMASSGVKNAFDPMNSSNADGVSETSNPINQSQAVHSAPTTAYLSAPSQSRTQETTHLHHPTSVSGLTTSSSSSNGPILPPLVQTSDGSWRVGSETITESRASPTPIIRDSISKPLGVGHEELIQMNRMLEIRVRALEERLALTEERLGSIEQGRRV